MAKITFGQYAPDISDLDTNVSSNIRNVLPRADGYSPFAGLEQFTYALPAACRGKFFARQADGSIVLFAGTSTNLYKLDNTDFSWDNVSSGGGPYAAVPSDDHWCFAQFNNLVIAVQVNVVPQVFDISSSTTFLDLAGSPPQSGHVTIINRFVVLSRLLGQATRVQWSGLNETTNWTSGTRQSDFQDLPDGGRVQTVVGGDYFGVVLQDASIRLMTYAPGSPTIFDFKRISKDDGLFFRYGAVTAADRVFFISPQSFKTMEPEATPRQIGKDRVDETFLSDVDVAASRLVLAATDPTHARVFWSYKSTSGQTDLFDKILCYDWVLDRWTPIEQTGEYLSNLARPGLSLEALDAIAPGAQTITGVTNSGTSNVIRITIAANHGYTTGTIKAISGVQGTTEANGNWTITLVGNTGIDLEGSTYTNAYTTGGIVGGNLDLLPFSLDAISVASVASLSGVDGSHQIGFFTGDNLEATLETPEQNAEGKRIFVRGVRPICDAGDGVISLGVRNTPHTGTVYTTETAINDVGVAPQRVDTRYVRARLRIPAGSTWTVVQSLEPDFVLTGER